jgi:molybdate transport system substrate-binding protein
MRRAAAVVAVALACTGCGSSDDTAGGSVTVVAAASLTEPFTELGRRFEAAHPGLHVKMAFATSPSVAAQVRSGAPADVVATADRVVVDTLAAEGLTGPVSTFARNRLAVAVAPGNPLGIRTVDDLARRGVDLVVCAVEVPCGKLAVAALARAAVAPRPRSYEPDVKAVIGRVALGEADAGVVYVTDVRSADGRVDGVPLEGSDLVADYGIAVVASGDTGRAQAFVDFVASSAGRDVLTAAGFEVP